jgi:hypothetical protein
MSRAEAPEDFGNFLESVDRHGEDFDVRDVSEPRSMAVPVSEVRRRRGRLADDLETGFRDVVLVERDGVLLWQTAEDLAGPGAGSARRRGRRGLRRALEGARVLREVTVPVLQPNEYLGALRDTDLRLNAACDAGLRRVRRDESRKGVKFTATAEGSGGPFTGRTLVIVHGTFSNAQNSLDEYAATEVGAAFLSDAITRYDGQVFVFDHPTLSVSPFINALDLARALAGTTGTLDVIAHSRGGVVVRWWLDVFGDTLNGATVRAVLAGSPLKGTSLAAPNRVQPLLNVLSNVGAFVGKTLGVAAAANPFSLASIALLKFIVRREKNRWGFPPVKDLGDSSSVGAAVAVIPGLHGQSAVSNNFELSRLRMTARRANVRYFAITSDFEPEKIGWKLWKVISEAGTRGKNLAADIIFPAENDLVVDTAHMTSLADDRDITDVQAFGSQGEVHHLNYFRQPQTIGSMRKWLEVAEGG